LSIYIIIIEDGGKDKTIYYISFAIFNPIAN